MERLKNWVSNSYLLLLFGIFPLFVHNYYYDLQEAKSGFFIVVTYIAAVVLLLIYIFYEKKNKEFAWEGQKFLKNRSLMGNRNNLPIYFLSAFLIWSCISALMTKKYLVALKGSDGRGMGILWLIACVLAFVISWRIEELHIAIQEYTIAVCAAIVFLIAFAHSQGVNFAGFLDYVPNIYRGMYLSTLGYINYVSQYASFIIIILTGFYCLTASRWLLPFMAISYLGLILGNSDAGFLATIMVLLIFPFLIVKNRKTMLLWSDSLLLFFIVCAAVSVALNNYLIWFNLGGIIVQMLNLLILGMGIAVLIGLKVFLVINKEESIIEKLIKIYKIGFLICVGCGILIFVMANLGVVQIGAITITDTFGSNRGYIWRKVLELYGTYPVKQKIFGCGPDALLPEMLNHFGPDMVNRTGQVFDSAHNEFLHYMATIGFPGALLYYGFLLSTIALAVRKRDGTRTIWLLAFIAFVVQGFLVPCQPVTTPFAFVFAGLANSKYREHSFSFGKEKNK